MMNNTINFDGFNFDGFFKALDLVNEMRDKTNALDWVSFNSVMCMLFDEYALAHKGKGEDYKAPYMAEMVAEQVKTINEELGEYKAD